MKKLFFIVFASLLCVTLFRVYGYNLYKSEVRIVSGGDLLISASILEASKIDNSKYNFDDIFKYVKPYIESADYAVINLETGIGGRARGYAGFPQFNTPKGILTSAKNAGFDLVLTASNHSYDLGYKALLYKLSSLEEKQLEYVGMRKTTEEPFHKVIEVKGVHFGILNYTRESTISTEEKVILNRVKSEKKKIVVDERGKDLIARFNYHHLDDFYETLEKDIAALKEQGAEIIVAYPHWGKEYCIEARDKESDIAQKMCDLGVDVIIGGHPHVVAPVKVLKSDISGKETVCIYSTGNFVSSMSHKQKKPNADYVEDGALFGFTVKRNWRGVAEVVSADVLPLWVVKENGKYVVMPLDQENNWKEAYQASYNRTMGLVKDGLDEFNQLKNKGII